MTNVFPGKVTISSNAVDQSLHPSSHHSCPQLLMFLLHHNTVECPPNDDFPVYWVTISFSSSRVQATPVWTGKPSSSACRISCGSFVGWADFNLNGNSVARAVVSYFFGYGQSFSRHNPFSVATFCPPERVEPLSPLIRSYRWDIT